VAVRDCLTSGHVPGLQQSGARRTLRDLLQLDEVGMGLLEQGHVAAEVDL